jgi:hypothetical protein
VPSDRSESAVGRSARSFSAAASSRRFRRQLHQSQASIGAERTGASAAERRGIVFVAIMRTRIQVLQSSSEEVQCGLPAPGSSMRLSCHREWRGQPDFPLIAES